jgi:hypothetical protein
LYFRPFQEKFNIIFVPVSTIAELIVIVVAYIYSDDPPAFIEALVLLTVSLQSFSAIFTLISSLMPLSKHVLRAIRNFRKKLQRNNGKHKNNNGSNLQSIFSAMNLSSLLKDESENNKDEEMLSRRDRQGERSSPSKSNRKNSSHHLAPPSAQSESSSSSRTNRRTNSRSSENNRRSSNNHESSYSHQRSSSSPSAFNKRSKPENSPRRISSRRNFDEI